MIRLCCSCWQLQKHRHILSYVKEIDFSLIWGRKMELHPRLALYRSAALLSELFRLVAPHGKQGKRGGGRSGENN